MKKYLIFLFYNFFVVLLLFAICEWLTRLFFPQIQPQGTDNNLFADNVYSNSSGLKPLSFGRSNGALVHINLYGFREYSTKADTSKISWLILGDSVTFGIGVAADSTFAGRLQSQIDSINILNPAMVGFAIQDYENLVNHFIIKIKNKFCISTILLFWCLNDIYLDVPDFETPGGSWRYALGDALKFFRSRSRFYMLLKTSFFDRPKSYYLFDEKFYEAMRPEFKKAIQSLKKISEICQSHEINFTFIFLPYEYQLRKIDSTKFKPQKLMEHELSQSSISYLDPVRFLCESGIKSKKLFLFGDGIHLSSIGHRLIAEFVIKSFH